MAVPENVRRSQEIKRLQKQLEDLRAARDHIAREKSAPSSQDSSPLSQASPNPVIENTFGSNGSSVGFEVRKHGTSSRFLSLSKVDHDEYFPRILAVAGRVPDLTVEEFESAPSVLQNRAPEVGNMFVTMLPPDYKGQIIAMPGLEIIAKCRDPIAVLIGADELSEVQLPIEEGDDLVLLVDRNTDGVVFQNTKFYAWAVDGHVKVGWAKDKPSPETARCLGPVVFGIHEVKMELRQKRSCWEEENEVYTG